MPTEQSATSLVPFTCTLDCGSRCELVAHVREGEVVRLDTPPGQVDTDIQPRLIPCIRGRSHRRLLSAPERLLSPLKRVGPRGSDAFEPIAWGEALDMVAQHLVDTRAQYGAEAIFHATGAGSVSGRGLSGASASRRFFSHWDRVTATTGSLSNHCANIAAAWMLGETVPGSDRATLLDSRLIIMWGLNPAENRMGPNTSYFVRRARDNGAEVILIDPRYTDSGVLADQWIPIIPGTDVALASALAHVMETEGLVASEFMQSHTSGYELYRAYVMGDRDGVPKTPEWAEPITGVSSGTIRELGRKLATIKPTALFPGWGPQRAVYGEQFSRAMIALACMSGNVGIRGGGLASVGTRSNILPIGGLPAGPFAAKRHISAGSWAPYILENSLTPPLKMAYIVASNLINRSPNTLANAQALEKLDFVVVNEPFLTPTARYADIVFPICSDLERSDLVASWGHDSHLFKSEQAIEPLGLSRGDYWVFSQLAQRLGFEHDYTEGRTEEEWLSHLLDTSPEAGAAFEKTSLWRADPEPRVALADFRADPVAHPLKTASGRIELHSPTAVRAGLPATPEYVAADREAGSEPYPLQLVTPHSKLRSNSCLDANVWLRSLERHGVWLNPKDAEARHISDGDLVEIVNQFGRMWIPAIVTERIMPGVVCIYQGRWYAPNDEGIDEGGSANVLTGHRKTPTGGPTTHTSWVQVRRREA